MVLLSLDFGQGMHPNSLDKVSVREGAVGPSFSPTATYRVPGYDGERKQEKSKDKGKRPHPEENRQRPPDHQARRRSRKETLTQVAERERVIGQHEENAVDKDSQESPTTKTCSSYEKKPARTKKIPKKQRQLKQVPTRKPTREGSRGKGATWTPPCSQVSQPTGRRPKFSKARRRETRCRILWSTRSPSRKTSR